MPLRAPTRNPYRAGQVVTCTKWNATGEGILWAVNKVKGTQVRIEPLLTLTGPSVLRPKWVAYNEVDAADLIKFGTAYVALGNILRELARDPGAGSA